MTTEDIIKLYEKKKIDVMNNGTDRDKEKIKVIQGLLYLDNWILKVSVNEALNILYFLGIERALLKDAYIQLSSVENYKPDEILRFPWRNL